MTYRVLVLPRAAQDIQRLAEEDREVARAAINLGLDLRENPYFGEPLSGELQECRRIRFDRQGWRGKPRYRLVYRNEPHDGAPHIVAVLAVGKRESLAAYRAAKVALIERLREQGHGP